MPRPPKTEPVHDVRVLRAIAHPTRNRILGELTAAGPLRAADVARVLDLPANQASFHLRQLAKYGLVEPAPDQARDGRDRVWRLVVEEGYSVSPAELEKQPGGKAAVTVWRSSAAAWAHEVVEAAFAFRREKDTHVAVFEHTLKLTKDEAAELSTELDDLLQAWTRRTRGRDAGRRTYLLMSMLQPYPERDRP